MEHKKTRKTALGPKGRFHRSTLCGAYSSEASLKKAKRLKEGLARRLEGKSQPSPIARKMSKKALGPKGRFHKAKRLKEPSLIARIIAQKVVTLHIKILQLK